MSEPMATIVPHPGARAREPLIVKLEAVGKAFRRFERQPFLLRNLMLRIVGRAQRPKEFWPLRGVSFEIRRGETVGLVGQNGSGKSTLLRLIAGACFPTEGQISVRGRIAPLLSLGAGFLPDMTGRECVEINDFIETPVRYYSSGMMARLGFSVAVHTNPDLLLVDEVLAVGDHLFQQKCIARIQELRDGGTTIMFVSHDAETVRRLCDRVLWLRDGHLVRDGAPGATLDEYLQVVG